MKIYAPSYYKTFHCIASACRHSCCKGWEVDIDEASLQRYRSMEGPLGKRLRASIAYGKGDEQPHFILKEGDCCPFLREGGLCDLILEKGEGILCQICADHPRFRSFWSEKTEIGLGLACEEAARIILSFPDPVTLDPIGEDDDPAETPSQNEQDLLELRQDLLVILQDRSFSVDRRMENFLAFCGLETGTPEKGSDCRNPAEGRLCIPAGSGLLPGWAETAFEQLAVYLLYRNYADTLYDGRLEDRLRFIAGAYCSIRIDWEKTDRSFESLTELARRFSCRYEYDIQTWGEFFDGR